MVLDDFITRRQLWTSLGIARAFGFRSFHGNMKAAKYKSLKRYCSYPHICCPRRTLLVSTICQRDKLPVTCESYRFVRFLPDAISVAFSNSDFEAPQLKIADERLSDSLFSLKSERSTYHKELNCGTVANCQGTADINLSVQTYLLGVRVKI